MGARGGEGVLLYRATCKQAVVVAKHLFSVNM